MRNVMIKVGSSSLVQHGMLNHEAFVYISRQAAALAEHGGRVAITTSGFAAAGSGKDEKAYQTGGNLITAAWKEHLGARAGSLQLVSKLTLAYDIAGMQAEQEAGLIPLVNGKRGDRCFGSNDQLSVIVAGQLGLKHVVLLGDQGAFYADPEDKTTRIAQVDLTRAHEYHQFIRDNSMEGTGGMEAKLDAAQRAAEYGLTSHYGHWQMDIDALIAGTSGTTFVNTQRPTQ